MNPIEKIDIALSAIRRVGSHALSIKSDVKAANEAVVVLMELRAYLQENLNKPSPASAS